MNISKREYLISIIIIISIIFSFIPLSAQEGLIAASYYEEKTMLKKMWNARKAGDEDKVKKLSSKLSYFIENKKLWAQDFLTLTENSIKEIQKENNPDITNEEREKKKKRFVI